MLTRLSYRYRAGQRSVRSASFRRIPTIASYVPDSCEPLCRRLPPSSGPTSISRCRHNSLESAQPQFARLFGRHTTELWQVRNAPTRGQTPTTLHLPQHQQQNQTPTPPRATLINWPTQLRFLQTRPSSSSTYCPGATFNYKNFPQTDDTTSPSSMSFRLRLPRTPDAWSPS